MSRTAERQRPRKGVSDEALVAAILRSDQQAFTVLYERYYQRVYKYCYLRLRNHADSEEAVQEIFTAVFRSIDGFRGRSSVLSWIYGVAKNTVNNTIRSAVARERRIDKAEPVLVYELRASAAGSPEEALTLQRCVESARNGLAALPAWQAEVFALRHVDDLCIEEISARTARSNDAVRSGLCRAKRALVAAIETGEAGTASQPAQGGAS